MQLWAALPDATRSGARRFEHHEPPVVEVGGAEALVFTGEWLGQTGAPAGDTAIFGAEVRIPAHTGWRAPLDPAWEAGVPVDRGPVEVDGIAAGERRLVALPAGRTEPAHPDRGCAGSRARDRGRATRRIDSHGPTRPFRRVAKRRGGGAAGRVELRGSHP